jgi:conjugative relaxase-like TrwC/TraI family protein
MSLVKISPSSWSYYASEVADGREDYYQESEVPGRFLGRGATALGFAGDDVSAEALERLFGHGTDPRDGEKLGQNFDERRNAVAGFAVTFAPPKSVSALWAVGPDHIADEVIKAHLVAMNEAFSFLEDNASFTRRGRGGVHQVDTEGFLAASFTHRTSRAADPQLHSHVLIANKVRADGGKWLAIDGRELFSHQTAAGMLYKAALRAELSSRLGVLWTAVDEKGIAEIVGVPAALTEAWSKRRRQVQELGARLIAEREARTGRRLSPNERAACFQVAAYRTRARKVEKDTPTEVLRARWTKEAEHWGHAPGTWVPLLTRHHQRAPKLSNAQILSLAVARLEDTAATWTRAEAVEVLSTLVTGTSAKEVRETLESLAERLLRHPEVTSLAAPLPARPPESLRRRDGMAVVERHGATRYTTKATLSREAFILEAAENGRAAKVAIVSGRELAVVLRRASLGEDQARAVRELVEGGERIACLVGPAGAGKSRALEAARLAWAGAGFRPIGLAPSAMAAGVLAEEAGLRSETLAKFLLDRARGDPSRVLDSHSVVILDEAAMARTDDLARLVRAVVDAQAKLVLVGDPDQLGAVGPGGVFRTLVGDHPSPELETVRRLAHAWEAAASLRLRAGDPSALSDYDSHGRISSGTKEEMLDRAFAIWREARDQGSSVLVMAGDNETAEELARRCQADRVERDEIEPPRVPIASGAVGVGDEVVTLRNDRRIRSGRGSFVRNGDRFEVISRGTDGSLGVRTLDQSSRFSLPSSYVAEHVALGYALTVHKAQGSTTDKAVVLVDEAMTRPQLYVGMTRGRQINRLLVVSTTDDVDHSATHETPPLEVLRNVLRHEGEDRSAHDVVRAALAAYEDRALLANLAYEARRSIDERAGPDRSAEILALERHADVEAAQERFRLAEIAVRQAEKEHRPGTRIWNEFHAARCGVEKARQARHELAEFVGAQDRRARWRADHPREVAWAAELESRLAEAERIADELASARRVKASMRQRAHNINATTVGVPKAETTGAVSPEIEFGEIPRRRAETSISAPEMFRSPDSSGSPSLDP